MSTMRTIPDSVHDYLTNPGIRSVVEHLLGQRDNELPVELEGHEVRDFHQAYLSVVMHWVVSNAETFGLISPYSDEPSSKSHRGDWLN